MSVEFQLFSSQMTLQAYKFSHFHSQRAEHTKARTQHHIHTHPFCLSINAQRCLQQIYGSKTFIIKLFSIFPFALSVISLRRSIYVYGVNFARISYSDEAVACAWNFLRFFIIIIFSAYLRHTQCVFNINMKMIPLTLCIETNLVMSSCVPRKMYIFSLHNITVFVFYSFGM